MGEKEKGYCVKKKKVRLHTLRWSFLSLSSLNFISRTRSRIWSIGIGMECAVQENCQPSQVNHLRILTVIGQFVLSKVWTVPSFNRNFGVCSHPITATIILSEWEKARTVGKRCVTLCGVLEARAASSLIWSVHLSDKIVLRNRKTPEQWSNFSAVCVCSVRSLQYGNGILLQDQNPSRIQLLSGTSGRLRAEDPQRDPDTNS